MELTVHLLHVPRSEAAVERLHALLHPDIHPTFGLEIPEPATYGILVAGRPEKRHLLASSNLESLVIPWAGIPESTRELMREFPEITVHNLHHNALPVAEHATALLLAAAKFIVPMDRTLRAQDWTPRYSPNPSLLLRGKTAMVLGYGAIGQEVARLCHGLGMRVLAVRRNASGSTAAGREGVTLVPTELWREFLAEVQALIVCLPHTPETTGFVGAEELALLPPSAVLVNIGRGPIVEEAALYHALLDGTLYAAGLDVWYSYPADEAARAHTQASTYPFHELDNVVLSPHRAGGSTETEMLRAEHLAELLNAAAQGRPLPNRVNLEVGY